ncbi:MAG: hypothetical protein JWR35_3079 [Marmoricola sp.]|nr:hypothetical protein [Marmoricola sp.]
MQARSQGPRTVDRFQIALRGLALGAGTGAVFGCDVMTAIIVGGVIRDGNPEALPAVVIYCPIGAAFGSAAGLVSAACGVCVLLLSGPRVLAALASTAPWLAAAPWSGWPALAGASASAVSAALLIPFMVSNRAERRSAGRVDA